MLIALSNHPFGWDLLPLIIPLTKEEILSYTIQKGQGVEDLTAYLDSLRWPGILRKLAEIRLKEIRPLLEEVLTLNEPTLRILADPRGFFGIQNSLRAHKKTVDYFIKTINQNSPPHVTRAMTAYISFGLEQYQWAIQNTDFAECEKKVANFGEKVDERRGEADVAMLMRAEHLADSLIELIKVLRDQTMPENESV